jgi:hypothetical protein
VLWAVFGLFSSRDAQRTTFGAVIHNHSSWVVTSDPSRATVLRSDLQDSGRISIGDSVELVSRAEAMDEWVFKLLIPETAKKQKASIISIENLVGSLYIEHGR